MSTSLVAEFSETPAQIPTEPANGFTSHYAQLQVGERKISLRVLKMLGATAIFVSDNESECLDELAVAMASTPRSKNALSTTIIGPQVASNSELLAIKLSKRYGRQFFVAYNVHIDVITAPLLERTLHDYICSNETQFV